MPTWQYRRALVALLLAASTVLAAPVALGTSASAAPCNPKHGCTTTSRPHGPPSTNPGCGHRQPYGCTTTTTPATAGALGCILSVDLATPGSLITVKCTGAGPGTTVQVLLDDRSVYDGPTFDNPRVVHAAAAATPQPFGVNANARHAASTVTSYVRLRLPDLAPGVYEVTVATQTRSATAGTLRLTAGHTHSSGGDSQPTGLVLFALAAVAMLAAAGLFARSRRAAA